MLPLPLRIDWSRWHVPFFSGPGPYRGPKPQKFGGRARMAPTGADLLYLRDAYLIRFTATDRSKLSSP
jgi:hypothetical protein